MLMHNKSFDEGYIFVIDFCIEIPINQISLVAISIRLYIAHSEQYAEQHITPIAYQK